MDHLPKVSFQATPLPPVPYLREGRFTYSRPFEDFALRIPVPSISEHGADYSLYSAYFQSWLFFGLLEAFFGEWDLPVDRADFLEETSDGHFVTSKLLQEYLVAAVAVQQNDGQSTIADKDTSKKANSPYRPQAVKRALERISNTYRILRTHHSELHQNVNADSVHPAIWDSIIILGATLARAKDLIFRPMRNESQQEFQNVDYSFFRLRSIPDFRYDGKRCPHERRVLGSLVGERLPEIAFFSQMRRSRPEKSHSECTGSECVAFQIEKTGYESRHVRGGCACEFVGFEEGDLPIYENVDNEDEDDKGEDLILATSQMSLSDQNQESIELDQSNLPETGSQDAQSVEGDLSQEWSSDSQESEVEMPEHGPSEASLNDLKAPEAGSDTGSKSFRNKPAILGRLKSQVLNTSPGQYVSKTIPACIFNDGKLETVFVPHLKATITGRLQLPASGWNFVAISHVWADGLGNNEGNKMPKCQLERLQGLANSLYAERHHPVPFWIDTLLIPKYSTSAGSKEEENRRKKLKTKALRNMEWVYKGSSKTLVLDSDLLSLPTVGLQPEEIGAHLMTSAWSRRLWTLQEGCKKERTWFQFADQALTWPKLHLAVSKRLRLSNWSSRLPKKHPIREAQNLDALQHTFKRTKFHLAGHFAASSPKAKALVHVDKRLYRVVNQVWFSIYSFLEELTVDPKLGFNSGVLMRCMRGMYYRNCSHAADEPLVLASLLSWLAGSAADIQSKSLNPEDRYKILFKKLKYVPRDVLFLDQNRYQDDSCRWMPTSLLAVNNPLFEPVERREGRASRFPKGAIPTNPMMAAATLLGVTSANLFAMTAVGVYAAYTMRMKSPMCLQEPRGLVTRLKSLRIFPRPTKLQAPFCIDFNEEHNLPFLKSQSAKWKVYVREPGTGRASNDLPEADWCLLVDASFRTIHKVATAPCEALLVTVKKWFSAEPGGVARFEGLALLMPLSEDENDNDNEDAHEMPLMEVQLQSIQSRVVPERWVVG